MSSVTNKGTAWELSRSAWMLWTLVPFLSGVAFWYIGLRTRQWKWTVWGGIYSLPLLGLLFGPSFDSEWAHTYMWDGLADVVDWIASFVLYALFAGFVCLVSLLHAVIIRRETLVRRAVLGESDLDNLHDLRNQMEIDHDVNILGNQIARNRKHTPPRRNDGANRVLTDDDDKRPL